MGPVEVDGDTVSVTWPESSPAGEFRAAYRVVSADGHPINGTITFTVEAGRGCGAVPPRQRCRPAPRRFPASPDPVSASPSAGRGKSRARRATRRTPALLVWVLGIGLAVLIGAGAGAWVMRRTR